MTMQPQKDYQPRLPWLLPVFGVSAALVGAIGFHYVAWQYVPHHLEHFAEAGTILPLSARLAIVIANWYVRLLPFVVIISGGLVAPLVAVVMGVVLARGAPRWLWPAFGIAFLCLATAEAVLCGIMLYGIQAGYATLGG